MNRPAYTTLAACLFLSVPALAQDYDFNWSTINHPGNAAYDGPDPVHTRLLVGRGQVDYTYRISKFETSTAQWMEFLNTFADNPQPHPFWDTGLGPVHWGAFRDGSGRYELRDVPDASMIPVSNITWRMGGLYCNWLHNGKSNDPAFLVSGAYDTTTWGTGKYGSFTDDLTHMTGAKFWIPTLDEQLKAFQYDPNRYGVGQGGWWLARNGSDSPGTPGPPGIGTTSAEVQDWAAWDYPLGAYANSISPWGLWDTSGGTNEWNEEALPYEDGFPFYPTGRGVMGSHSGPGNDTYVLDMAWEIGSRTLSDSYTGLRIAGAIPASSTALLAPLAGLLALRRSR